MKRLGQNYLVLLAVAAPIVLGDQITKHLVLTRLAAGQSLNVAPWLDPILRVTHLTNTGVAFGMFPKAGNFFAAVSAVVAVVILVYCWRLPSEPWFLRVALALPLAGSVGNLIDRLRLGSVVDFIDLNFWPLHNWPIFNLADASTITGVILLAVLMLWEEQLERSGQRVAEGS